MSNKEHKEHKDHHVDVVNGMETGHGKIPKFLVLVYAFLGVWAVAYAIGAGPLDERDTMAAPQGVSVETGKGLAGQCLACHGVDLGGGIGPSLKGIIDNIGEEEFIHVLKEGKNTMPALGAGWTDDQMGSMIEYLKTIE